MSKRTSVLIAALAVVAASILGCVAGCQPRPQTSHADSGAPRVRVRLLAAVTTCTLTADRAVPILDSVTGRPAAIGLSAGRPLELSFDGSVWRANGRTLSNLSLRIDPDADGAVSLNGLAYRGAYAFIPSDTGRFDVVNDVDVESYLQGVLAKELLPDWHPEAYRAQAVIARTYALYEARTNPTGRTWDLLPDERSQVYGGIKAETAKATAAVEATRGIVAAYGPGGQERIFKAYFSSCCGGVCASAADVFNEPAIPPLAAKSNGTTCSISTRFNWPAVQLSKAELTRRFRLWGERNQLPEAKLTGVRNISIATANAFGRPRTFLVTDANGQQYALTAEQLRWAINTDPNGGSTVFSGFFRPVDADDAIRFTDGHGFGHGVGACQWCMQARALAGEHFGPIVLQAYPQAVLVQAF